MRAARRPHAGSTAKEIDLNNSMLHRIGLAAVLLAAAPLAPAQAYPNKPIRLVIPQAPGGGSDTLGRFVAQKLADAIGQQVVADNKPGAAGMLGAELVKQAPPDGYTLLLSAIDTITAPLVSRRAPFDGVRDFTPVTQLAQSPNVWLVSNGFEARTMKELIERARAQPGKIDYASSGVGGMQHLGGELLVKMAGVQLAHVPYKGGPPAFADVVAGRVPVMISGIQGALPQIKGGKVRGLAVTGKKRSGALPDLPTVAEALGLPDYEALNWQGLLFPPGTPPAIVDRIAGEVIKILAAPDSREKLEALGYEPIGNTPAQAAAVMAAEQRKWTAVIREAGISSD
jgi:tripartite-type tricarboxylate transporter receptor subunit TctC